MEFSLQKKLIQKPVNWVGEGGWGKARKRARLVFQVHTLERRGVYQNENGK